MTTIAAIATPPGIGGVGIVRVSGPLVPHIAEQLLHFLPKPRHAHYSSFYDQHHEVIDQGLALYFVSPHSFTGEDVLELQGHGGMIVLDRLLKRVLECGAVLANPGEFTERAYLNNKIDLVQAEAVADLIHASSIQAARAAVSSLSGVFSVEINKLHEKMVSLRVYVEAAIDFAEEEIDFLQENKIIQALNELDAQVVAILSSAKAGQILQEGLTIVLVGQPNAGKSSLMNLLVGKDAAIVTPVAGTTRDLLKEQIHLDGLPLHIIDTAGIRESDDVVEIEGIKRAISAIEQADKVLLIVDSTSQKNMTIKDLWPEGVAIPSEDKVILVRNKVDLSGINPGIEGASVNISAKTGEGVSELKALLKQTVGYQEGEGLFLARRRHLEALNTVQHHIKLAKDIFLNTRAGELLAEELLLAQESLGSITGKMTSDDLLGEIFANFCIGK